MRRWTPPPHALTRSPRTPRFPETRLSLLTALASTDPDRRHAAADLLYRAYRAPVLDIFRWRWHLGDADAEDAVQEFFATALDKGWLERFDPERARFRTFLRLCADRFAAHQVEAGGRQKRGGGMTPLAFDDVAHELVIQDDPADARFRAEWVRSVLSLAVDALTAEAGAQGRHLHLILFRAYDLADVTEQQRPSYAELAATHQLTDSEVINHLAWARRRFRVHVLEVVRQLAGSDQEYREDVRDLLGIDPP
ncbi:MAG: sigma-70 family RNA polymerase sigma factor [Gemmatimonadetes bacterium]|nr:sigma-70 family RNA polymerase sigma factor [Gemmatimonadota bacterium]